MIISLEEKNLLMILSAIRKMENCHDCKRILKKDEEYMEYPGTKKIKCKECHIKEPILRNYQPTECYSRVVGYIRPVKQWNKGKQEEWKDRKTFKV